MIGAIYIDDQRLNLFEDESVIVNSSIADVSDIKKVTTDYSKDFTVPATKTNNKFFKHYYNADIDNTFDARTKVKGFIELGGLPFKFGKIRLLKVNVKKGKPESYTINFVGNLVDIAKEVGRDELSDLDLSAYDHDFDSLNVKGGLTDFLFGGDVIYTLNPKKQYFYNSDPSDTSDNDLVSNIAANGGTGLYGVRFTDLAPSLKAIRILEAIESKYDLQFSRDFFGTSSFNKLYQTITNSEKNISGETQTVDFDGGDTDHVSLTTNEGSFYVRATSASNDNVAFRLFMDIIPSAGYENVPYTITTIIDGNEDASVSTTGSSRQDRILTVNGETTYVVRYQVSSGQEFKYTGRLIQLRTSSVPSEPAIQQFITTAGESTINSIFITSKNITKIKVIDWLVGFFKAFKLIIIPQDDGSFYVDTLNRYYSKGRVYDVTKYIKTDSHDVNRGDLFSEILFNFEEPKTILNTQFEINNGIYYGDAEVKLEDEDGEPLDGDTYEIEVPFETVIYDRLKDVATDENTRVMYAPFIDADGKPTVPNTNLFYNVPKDVTSTPIRFIGDNNVIETIAEPINTASHFNGIPSAPSSDAFLFSPEYSEWDGMQAINNLYTNYHQKYIDGIFNIRRRNYNFKAVLPLHIITKLRLNDVLKIKDSYYRIDNYDFNINNQECSFKLINTFKDDLKDLLDTRDILYFGSDGGGSTARTTVNNPRSNVVDLGAGADWFMATENGSNLEITVDPNATGYDRQGIITVFDLDKTKDNKDIVIYQEGDENDRPITSDNGTVTSDSNTITSDNG